MKSWGPYTVQRELPAEPNPTAHARRGFYGGAPRRLGALLLSLAALCACGGSPPATELARGRAARDATLVLDFTPNAVHAGIYAAIARHLDLANRVRLHVVVPSASTDSIKLLEVGRVNFAILDIHDLAIAREHGADLVGIMAVVQRPLSGVIAAPEIQTPRQLEGKPVGITGVPSDSAVLASIVAGAGGNPRRVPTVTIGFNAVADLLAHRVAAATAFWNDEGVTLARARPGFHTFKVDDYGAPSYPELVVSATGASLRHDRSLAAAVVRTLVAGYGFTLAHPERSAAELERLVPGLDPRLVAAQLHALLPAFRAADGRVGELNPASLSGWARWEARFGIVSRPPDVAGMFDPSFAGG